MSESNGLRSTPLTPLHRELGARLVPFAGYSMPVQYPTGIIGEHLHTRSAAGLFDVSHMGQIQVSGASALVELEALMPVDLEGLSPGEARYALLTNSGGGVHDDLIITRLAANRFLLVVNGACKAADEMLIRNGCPRATVDVMDDQALLALQGPEARAVLQQLAPSVSDLVFMCARELEVDGVPCLVSCSGYTGEDGFELSIPASAAAGLARRLLQDDRVAPVGLGARDSLRLEAGLCLYGHELGPEITPVEAGVTWAIPKSRRPNGARPGGYPGHQVISKQLAEGPGRTRVGLRIEGRRPVREGQVILSETGHGIGQVTSGGFGPSLNTPVAMGFVTPEYRAAGTPVAVDVRGKTVAAHIVDLPMVKPGYIRSPLSS